MKVVEAYATGATASTEPMEMNRGAAMTVMMIRSYHENTKCFMIFFVVSTFRDFVIRNLFLFRFIQVSYFDIRI